jgi:succinate dehydrogenase hydrophobic membrane anchor protein
MNEPDGYQVFLLRLHQSAASKDGAPADGVRMILEDTRTGQRHVFASGESLVAFLAQAGAAATLGSPLVAVVMILFIIASVWHMKIGMQVVLEDYVTDEKAKLAAIIANNFFSAAVGLASIYAIVKLSSGV